MAPPHGAIPPPLPPSVEEAYRRKCIQLKQRMNEVEEANDASRLRIIRMERSVQKMRLERAFLLEQLAKRTSTNVEDSEGSPSPPPTPKEKPLRTKRGHRKPSFLTNLDGRTGSTFIQQGPVTLSPSSDAFSHTHPELNSVSNAAPTLPSKRQLPANGHPNPSASRTSTPPQKRPKTAFDLYCNDLRSVITVKNRKAIADGTFDVERALATGWREMDEEQRGEFQRRLEGMKRTSDAEKEASVGGTGAGQSGFDGESRQTAEADEDVEMGEDGDDGSRSGGEVSGFTAVNRA